MSVPAYLCGLPANEFIQISFDLIPDDILSFSIKINGYQQIISKYKN